MNRTTLLILLLAFAAGVAGFTLSRHLQPGSAGTEQLSAAESVPMTAAQTLSASVNSDESGPVGKPMPAFALPDLSGEERTQQDFIGKPLVVNFWATWCGPCRKEMPELMALHAQRGDELTVLGIALDLKDDVASFVDELGVAYPIVVAEDLVGDRLAKAYGNAGGLLPFTAFVDASGVLRELHLGPITLEQIEEKVAAL